MAREQRIVPATPDASRDFAILHGDIVENGPMRPRTLPFDAYFNPLPKNRHERRRREKLLKDRKKKN